eukprot:320083-Chlamydomonas_euryale.AAC.11
MAHCLDPSSNHGSKEAFTCQTLANAGDSCSAAHSLRLTASLPTTCPLLMPCHALLWQAFQLLISLGADVSIQDADGQTAKPPA